MSECYNDYVRNGEWMNGMTKEVVHAIQDEYPDDFAWCFGCGRLNEDGYHFRTGWQGEETVTYYEPSSKHIAIPGFVYGGLIASLVDCHGTGSLHLHCTGKTGMSQAVEKNLRVLSQRH